MFYTLYPTLKFMLYDALCSSVKDPAAQGIVQTVLKAHDEIVGAEALSVEVLTSSLRLDTVYIRVRLDHTYPLDKHVGFFDVGIDVTDCGIRYQKFEQDGADFGQYSDGSWHLLLPDTTVLDACAVLEFVPGVVVTLYELRTDVLEAVC